LKTDRLVYVSLHCKDLEKSAHFYSDLAGVLLEQDEPGHFEHAWHNPYLHFAIFETPENEKISYTEIGFSTDDLDEVHKRMISEHVKVVELPAYQPWGYSASYLDPDGNIVNMTVVKSQ
jgi:predicted enzyme related to lactoylglutathione lyase